LSAWGPLRPDVVIFGGAVPAYGIAEPVTRNAEVPVVVGTEDWSHQPPASWAWRRPRAPTASLSPLTYPRGSNKTEPR
jgi:hypothetical protein